MPGRSWKSCKKQSVQRLGSQKENKTHGSGPILSVTCEAAAIYTLPCRPLCHSSDARLVRWLHRAHDRTVVVSAAA